MNRIASALVGGILALGVASPASAAGAQHFYSPETWDGAEHFAAGEGPCVPWPGTFHEVRTGGYDVVTAPGGQLPGEIHVNGSVDGYVELIPDDPTLPTYTGNYREKVDGIATGFDDENGDVTRVVQYHLRVPMTGTDGSSFVIVLSGKVTMDAKGTVRVARDRSECR